MVKKLWQSVLPFTKEKDITLDLYIHNTKAIAIYKRWEFLIDKKRGTFYRHWPEWPNGLQAKCLYMRLRKTHVKSPVEEAGKELAAEEGNFSTKSEPDLR